MPLRKKRPVSHRRYRLYPPPDQSNQLPPNQEPSITNTSTDQGNEAINNITYPNQLPKKNYTSHRYRFSFLNLGCWIICRPRNEERLVEDPVSTTIAEEKQWDKDTDTMRGGKRVSCGVPVETSAAGAVVKEQDGGGVDGVRNVATIRPKVAFDVIYEEDEEDEGGEGGEGDEVDVEDGDSKIFRAPRRRETHLNIREINRRQATSPGI
ncbi:hypothetical protein BZA77DRAFT_290209 [Pyronema omphalodes]|nr:hypothetical protein BZA77DRAFT_290209 [Pyronema omphalodes]